jgi:hypothetical protein
MYDTVYEDMVKCGIATKLENDMLATFAGKIVNNKVDSDGLPTKYVISHPDLLVFVDETSNNTNQKTLSVGMKKESFLLRVMDSSWMVLLMIITLTSCASNQEAGYQSCVQLYSKAIERNVRYLIV